MWSFDAVPLVPQMGAGAKSTPDGCFDFDDQTFHSLAGYAAPSSAKCRQPEEALASPPLGHTLTPRPVREDKVPAAGAYVPVPLPADSAKDLDDLADLCASMSDRRMSIGEADFDASFGAGAGAGYKVQAGGLPAFSDSLADQLSYHSLEQTLACPLALTIATEMGGAANANANANANATATTHKGKRHSLSDLYMDRDIEAARALMDEEEEQRDTASDASNSEHGGNGYTDDDDDDDQGGYEGVAPHSSDDATGDQHQHQHQHQQHQHQHQQHSGHTGAADHHRRHGIGGKRNPSIRRSSRSTRTHATNSRRTSRQGGGGGGKGAQKRGAASGGGGGGGASTPMLPIPKNAVLSTDHVIARGRRRRIQLSKMTKAQIAIETEARMEKNRQLARDCRRRKKMKINTLEDKVTEYEATIGKQDAQIDRLEAEVAKLRAMLRHQ